MQTVKGKVNGHVQGVGFRYFVQQKATLHDLAGYAKNLDDGGVEFVLQGAMDEINLVIQHIKQGPPHAKVQSVSYSAVEGEGVEEFSRFDIRY